MYENEIWKQIEDLPYEVSNYGRFKSHRYDKDHKTRILGGSTTSNGYIAVSIYHKKIYLHRLVAYYFVDGYKEGLFVNHKDLNKKNNHYTNLEWVTNVENVKHAWSSNAFDFKKFGRPYSEQEKEHKRATSPRNKRVLNTSTGEEYRSCRELARILQCDNGALARQIRNGRKRNGILYTYIN